MSIVNVRVITIKGISKTKEFLVKVKYKIVPARAP